MPDWNALPRTVLVTKCLEFEKAMDALITKHNVAIREQHRLIKNRATVINSAVELAYQAVLDRVESDGEFDAAEMASWLRAKAAGRET